MVTYNRKVITARDSLDNLKKCKIEDLKGNSTAPLLSDHRE